MRYFAISCQNEAPAREKRGVPYFKIAHIPFKLRNNSKKLIPYPIRESIVIVIEKRLHMQNIKLDYDLETCKQNKTKKRNKIIQKTCF